MTATSIDTVRSISDTVHSDLERLRKAAGQVVGSIFYGTILKTMRESKIQGAYGHGGRGEEVFAAQLHDLLAQRMGTARRSDLGEAMLRRLEPQQRLISQQRAAGLSLGGYPQRQETST